MHIANAKNKSPMSGQAGRTPAVRSQKPSTVGETAKSGPIRGYIKLSDAVKFFGFNFKDKTVLDIGSSTGGFTEFALKNGAKKVIAVEKGTNQMKSPLRLDPKIDLHEKTDIFNVKTQGDTFKDRKLRQAPLSTSDKAQPCIFISKPDVIVADVSFLSLTKILKYAKINLSRSDTDFLVMLKPQFEARPDQLHKGVVKNEKIRREIIKNFELWLKQNNFLIIKKRDNDLAGKNGNLERFYHLKLAK